MHLTLGQFAKAASLSKPHVSKLVKQGKITAIKQPNGSYQIDPSELDRFLGNRSLATPELTPLDTLHEAWERERQLLLDQITDLKQERDAWRFQCERLLTPPQKRSWWDWWRGR